MKRMLEYKGYRAKIEFDAEDMIFVGEVFGIRDSLNFHGTTIEELNEMFHQSIDNYLEMCAYFSRSPDKEYKGNFNVRIDSELHRKASEDAIKQGITLNQYVENAIKKAVNPMEHSSTFWMPALGIVGCIQQNDDKMIKNRSDYLPTEKRYYEGVKEVNG